MISTCHYLMWLAIEAFLILMVGIVLIRLLNLLCKLL